MVMKFADEFELAFELLNELELTIDSNGVVMIPELNQPLRCEDLLIKASVRPDKINYTGQGEIAFDILNDIRLMTKIFGYYLVKKSNEGVEVLTFHNEEYLDETTDLKYHAVTVVHGSNRSTTSRYYHNRCLKFIDMIFKMEGDEVDLTNFDNIEEDLLRYGKG